MSDETESPYSMTESLLELRRRKPSYGRLSTQLFVGTLACLSSISLGTTLGWSHPVSQNLVMNYEDVADNKLTVLLSISLLGCGFGVSSCSFMINHWGPKRGMQFIGVFYILTWWLILIPRSAVQLPGRFFLGFLGISYSMCGETLYLQTVHFRLKRYISVFQNSSMVFGVFISHVVGVATTTFYLSVCCALIPTLHYFFVLIVPESPVFLYQTSHVAAAKSLAWYRGEGNFYEDMANLKKDWDATRYDADSYGYMFTAKVVYRGLLIVLGVTYFQAFGGYFIFLFYEVRVWAEGSVISPVVDSTLGAFFFVVSKLLWSISHEFRWKNVRPLLISSCFFSALALTAIAVYLILDNYGFNFVKWLNWMPTLALACFLFAFEMGLNYFPKVLTFEYMPFQVYKRASMIVQSVHWLIAFINIYCFASSFTTIPTYVAFIILAVQGYVGTVFCYYFVVEPRGKSLVQVQLELGGNPIGKRGALYNQTKRTHVIN
ncbi:solute carrier family 2, facilitated glucose transporter member 2 [Tribolium castaneum]|uniref:Facilitated trehalose transporter Tret1-2 homolog-like Protein n=1 Tax=Tribolium castaneum TaxID=7070 RepID=D6X2E1_TRICA|nr:PREDICTED: solute carrier family 2, facilitated glucose transporter member 2 isoform X2 [Tribolium castaneum]EFA09872.1 Facilitated trehalose transporter Tret1-2 homolog-like Protein [Tribolium castaneum]|eukprot:XP_008197861.1 PREDICTED: solute carrier family 2, facilitated glucose transporter member 2 isoform X2 [Tribolium castaneum]